MAPSARHAAIGFVVFSSLSKQATYWLCSFIKVLMPTVQPYPYRPRTWFHRTFTGSKNAATPPHVLTLVPTTSLHLTGTSISRYPSRRPMNSTSTSKPKPSSNCRRKISRAARASNSLKPHCVSWNGRPVISRIDRLNTRPAFSRNQDWCTPINRRSSARDPTATCAPSRSVACHSVSSSSIGAERSASVNSAHSPRHSIIPWRTA